MFKKIFDFIFGKGGNKTKEKESKQQQTKYQDEGPKPCKISKQERIGILMKAKPLLEEAESFCEEVLKDKNPKTVMWGQMYNEAKAYRRRINEEYPEIFENDTVSPGDMIEVPQGDGKLYVYDAIASLILAIVFWIIVDKFKLYNICHKLFKANVKNSI